jgi:hypothetical protein
MYHCVAAVDEVMEHLREWAVGELEITLFDRKNFESQKRVRDSPIRMREQNRFLS